jgi:hypothetical protein
MSRGRSSRSAIENGGDILDAEIEVAAGHHFKAARSGNLDIAPFGIISRLPSECYKGAEAGWVDAIYKTQGTCT